MNSEEELKTELQRLRAEVSANRRRIRNSRALTALLSVCVPLLFFEADLHLEEKVTGTVKTRNLDIGELTSLLVVGLGAIGVISGDEMLSLLTRTKPSEPDDRGRGNGG